MQENNTYDEYEIDLREYIMLLWNKKWLIIGLVVIAMVAAWAVSSFFMGETYETEVTLRMTDVSGPYSSVEQTRENLRSESIAGPILSEYGYEPGTSSFRNFVRNNINLSRIDDTNYVRLEVAAGEAETVYQIAEKMTEAFLEGSDKQYDDWMDRREDELETYRERRESYDQQIQDAEQQIQELAESDLDAAARNLIDSSISQRISLYVQEYDRQQERIFSLEDEIADSERAEVINAAYLPANPSAPRVTLNIAVAAVLAGMIGVFGVFFIEFLKEDEE
ncbi:MAG: Wzz/FepE/Etk N-terminal domain-containing protein [Bacillota bacterium]